MISPEFWNESGTAPLINHIWQSTVAVAIAWALAAALRKNHARVRYWIWFAASVKFLLPFSLLIAAGAWLRSLIPAAATQPAVASVMEQVTQPFGQTQLLGAGSAPPAMYSADFLRAVLIAVWLSGALVIAIRFGRAWAKVNAAKRSAKPLNLKADVPVLSLRASIEPGIFGIFRPVLLLPDGILEQLTAEQMRAIMAHEMCHVRRRDNLTFAIHMAVEALFWFHPAVWWIGARMIDERERACDEAVVQQRGCPESYAEGILNVCKFYVESPLACAAGVTGADLKHRIIRIMAGIPSRKLGFYGKLLLSSIGVVAVAVPLIGGLVSVAPVSAQLIHASGPLPSFEVATIKPFSPAPSGRMQEFVNPPNIFQESGTTARDMVRVAYGLPPGTEARVLGGPSWIDHNRYEIEAKIPDALFAEMQKMPPKERGNQMDLMAQSLLADRFKLKVHFETREMPIYELVVAKGGPKLILAKEPPSEPDTPQPPSTRPQDMRQGIWIHFKTPNTMEMVAKGTTLDTVITAMDWPEFGLGGNPIVNRTGLTGKYDFVLDWAAPHPAMPESDTAAAESDAPPLSIALEQQLGLKLVKTKGPAEFVVIDHIELPSPN